MYFILTESQASSIAKDFSYLVGKPIHKDLNLLVEKINSQQMDDGSWQVYLETYLGDKDNWHENAGHSIMTTNLFYYLTSNQLIDNFAPDKYGLSPL